MQTNTAIDKLEETDGMARKQRNGLSREIERCLVT